MMNETGLLTVAQTAAALTVKPSCIRRWIHEQKLTTVHIGRLVRVPSTEVDRIIRQGIRPSKPTKR